MSRRSKIGEIEVPEDEDADFERVMNHLGLIAYRTVLAQAGAKDVETLRDITWDELRECGLTVPVRQKVLAWQNEEVYIPRWSSGTCGCTSSRRSCAAVSLCPCYVFNIVYIEAGIQPNPCPLFGCALYLCCAPVFFSCLGCFNRQQLGVKYGIAPKYPAPSFWICVEDFCCHLLCHPCSLCQEFREVGHRNPPGRRLQSDLVEETNQDHLMAAPPPPTPDALDSDPRKWTPANLLLWLDEHHFPEVALAAASSGTTGGGGHTLNHRWLALSERGQVLRRCVVICSPSKDGSVAGQVRWR